MRLRRGFVQTGLRRALRSSRLQQGLGWPKARVADTALLPKVGDWLRVLLLVGYRTGYTACPVRSVKFLRAVLGAQVLPVLL